MRFGADEVVVIAGPCAVESADQITDAAQSVARAGATVLRGGAYKLRTHPDSFQGLGERAVPLLAAAAAEAGLATVTEVVRPEDVAKIAEQVDAIQIGARNMHSVPLLQEAGGQSSAAVVLKRGFGATIREWLLAAEYVARAGNDRVILCERGIRAFGSGETRYVLDLAGAVWAHQNQSLPVIVDPSHATGDPALVGAMARATVAAGLDGLMIESHPDPASAQSDGAQALTLEAFAQVMADLRRIAPAVSRSIAAPSLDVTDAVR